MCTKLKQHSGDGATSATHGRYGGNSRADEKYEHGHKTQEKIILLELRKKPKANKAFVAEPTRRQSKKTTINNKIKWKTSKRNANEG